MTNLEVYKECLAVEIDALDPSKVNVVLPPHLIEKLKVIAKKRDFTLKSEED